MPLIRAYSAKTDVCHSSIGYLEGVRIVSNRKWILLDYDSMILSWIMS